MMHAIKKGKINAVGEKTSQVVLREKLIRFYLKEIGLHPLTDRIPQKPKFWIDCYRRALGEGQCRTGFRADF